ncbi:MAG: amidohydrolase family protein [Oscillospiraceae bacterium]|nr:amidohydrolase family protein [Oscillospiraceae bacterium]
MFERVLKGGIVVDGTGTPGYVADIALEKEKIAAIGANLQGKEEISVSGYTVAPGFIDIHRHADAEVFRPGFGALELAQGLTSIVNGVCGLSLAPFGEAHRQELLQYLRPVTGDLDPRIPTESIGDYLDALQELPIHVGMMVGGGTVRSDVCGYAKEDPEDFSPIHKRIEAALSQGALGVSLGLGYAPECFYNTKGLVKALAPLQNSQYPIAVHMREEGDMVCQAIEEMLTVARALRCPLHISHLKAMGKRNWGKRIPTALSIMDRARQEGLDVSCDVYLYEAGSTQLLHLLPPDFLAGGVEAISQWLRVPEKIDELRHRIQFGRDFDNIAQMIGWDNIIVSSLQLPQYQHLIGKTMEEISELLSMDPVACLCRLLSDENCAVTMIDRINHEEDICSILRDPYSSVISDATYPGKGLPHPRVYGTYSRLFERYVCDKKVLSVEAAVHKCTGLPAQAMRLKGKGLLKPGMDADIAVFHPETLREHSTFMEPRQLSTGMEYVFIAGQPALWQGKPTHNFNGSVLQSTAP